LCFYTLALRKAEALNLKWVDIDREIMVVRVTRKGGRVDLLPLNQWAIDAIEAIPRIPGSDYVFTNPQTKKRIVDVTKAIRRAVKKANVRKHVSPHLFRHSFATHMAGHNINLRTIQQYLGHMQIETTEIYTHIAIQHLSDASNRVLDEQLKTIDITALDTHVSTGKP